jgi:hypothetical protein
MIEGAEDIQRLLPRFAFPITVANRTPGLAEVDKGISLVVAVAEFVEERGGLAIFRVRSIIYIGRKRL